MDRLLLRAGVVLLVCITLSGCFTLRTWFPPNAQLECNDDGFCSIVFVETEVEPEPRTLWGVVWRILWTPFALVLDIATFPIQAFFAEESSEEPR